jgi:hypothetical protein
MCSQRSIVGKGCIQDVMIDKLRGMGCQHDGKYGFGLIYICSQLPK